LCGTVDEKAGGKEPEWKHIPDSEVELLKRARAAWRAAYEVTLVPHTPAQTLAKNEARQAAEAVIRPFVGQWLMWKQVTDAEREDAGVHNKKPRRPAIPAPETVPELEPRAGIPRQVVIPYRDKGSTHRGKPADVHGIEVCWALLDHPPADIESELTHTAFDTKSPLILNFQEHDRGKRIYMAGAGKSSAKGSRASSATSRP
jgi:hypothetical protein